MNITEIIDKMDNLNAMIDVCQGYTESEHPSMKKLSTVLFNIYIQYEEVKEKLSEISHKVNIVE